MKSLVKSIALVGALLLLNALFTGSLVPGFSISPYFLQILCLAGINIVLAVSLNLINGFTGQFSIGHAGFMAIGAYVSAFLSITFGDRIRAAFSFAPVSVRNSGLLLVVLAAGALAAAIAGFLVGVPSLRLRGDYLAIVTLGFGEIIRVFIVNIDAIGGARGLGGMPRLANFFWIYLFAAATVAAVTRIVNSSFGRTLIAIREDEIAAEAMGVNTTRHKVLSFVVSSAMAGVAGGLFAHYLMYLHPNSFTFIKSFEIIIMIVIGGLGSITGSVLGAVLYIVLTEGLREFAQYRMVLFSLLLIVIMIVRPGGILGHRELWSFFRRRRAVEAPMPPAVSR
ncbi:MAG TPA: branched-chain amino acid ABC transporter permease [Thermoanaerobaculia bacterium]|nr:branched-chain amino acid ABC transporter permease [Thermoanaerobaculia bacterium]